MCRSLALHMLRDLCSLMILNLEVTRLIHISGNYNGPQSWEFHCQHGIRWTQNSFKECKKAVSETLSQGNRLEKQEKIVTSAVALALFLSWLLPKADLSLISYFFLFLKIYIVEDK